MSTWLTFTLAILGTVGFFGGLYFLITLVVEGIRAKGKARLGIFSGDKPGSLGLWVKWEPEQFNVQIYRFRVSHASPDWEVKEGMFTVSYDPPQKAPFAQVVELPETFRKLIETSRPTERALITVDFRTVDGFMMASNYTLNTLRKVYRGGTKSPVANLLPLAAPDHATVMSLDYSEWVLRKKKLKDLDAAAKAKAAKTAAAKPAAAPVKPAPTPAAVAVPIPAKPEAALTPSPATKPIEVPIPQAEVKKAVVVEDKPAAKPAPASSASPVVPPGAKSVRDAVKASNAAKVGSEVGKEKE